jgi:predicted N-acetyltransferase YhbS
MADFVVSFDIHAAALRPVAVRDETPADGAARDALLDAALGAGRLLKTCERLRTGCMPAEGLALAAVQGDRIVGTIRLWDIVAGDRPALLLGPLCVDARLRSQGLGGRLILESLRRAAARGHEAVLLVGDGAYYERFGFERRLTSGLRMPGPVEAARFLGLELVDGALRGARGLVEPKMARPISRSFERRAA